MDKLSKSILRYMASRQNASGIYWSVDDSVGAYAHVPINDLCTAVDASYDDVMAAVDHLVKIDYLEYKYLSSRRGPVRASFKLTHLGIHHKEFRQLSQRERWKERIWGFLSGVGVSLMGAIIAKAF